MSKLKVRRRKLTEAELAALLVLLQEAGCDVSTVQLVGEEAEHDAWDETLILSLTSGVCEDPALEADMLRTQRGGGRVICVWPQDAPSSEVPLSIDKYAFSIVHWNAPQLARVLKDDAAPRIENPDGQLRPEPETEREVCK